MDIMKNESGPPGKSILTNDPDSSPEARALRLKRLRTIANLTRKQICENSGLNINTYIGYEVARYGGLTRWGAEKVITRLAQEGVICTFNWLMYNIGAPPTIPFNLHEISTPSQLQTQQPDNEEKLIIDELLLFRSHYKN